MQNRTENDQSTN